MIIGNILPIIIILVISHNSYYIVSFKTNTAQIGCQSERKYLAWLIAYNLLMAGPTFYVCLILIIITII